MPHTPEQAKKYGRKGGQSTMNRHGHDFFKKIGRKGGDANKQRGKHWFAYMGSIGRGNRGSYEDFLLKQLPRNGGDQ